MSAINFNYRKVTGKRKRVQRLEGDIDREIDEILLGPPQKKVKVEPDWFHNYEPIQSSSKEKAPSVAKHPLQAHRNQNIPSAFSKNAVKLQPKSLELISRSKSTTKVNIPKIESTESGIGKDRSNRTTKRALREIQEGNITKRKSKAKPKRRVKQVTTVKVEKIRTKEQELFPYEGLAIFERIFVGGINVAKDKELIEQRKVTAVVNATKELPNYFEEDCTYFKIPVVDSIDAPLNKYFDKAAAFIHEHLEASKDNHVLVHCQMGQSRSPSIIIAYAMKYLEMTLAQMWKHINLIHADLKINEGFKLQLMEYEKNCFGTNSLDFYERRSRRKPNRFANIR